MDPGVNADLVEYVHHSYRTLIYQVRSLRSIPGAKYRIFTIFRQGIPSGHSERYSAKPYGVVVRRLAGVLCVLEGEKRTR